MAGRFNNGGFGGFAGFGGDNSGAGFVNPRLFNNQANKNFWQRPRDVPNRPHSAIPYQSTAPTISANPVNRPHTALDYTDPRPPNRPHQAIDDLSGDMPPIGFSGGGTPGQNYSDSINGPELGSRRVGPMENYGDITAGARMSPRQPVGGEATATVEYPSPGGRSPTFVDTGDGWVGAENVATARSDGLPTVGGLDNGPDLYSNNRTLNPFDEWWRTGEPTQQQPSITVNPATSTNSGGSIWEGDHTLSDFGSDVALGPDINTSLDALGYGENYPPTPPATDPNLIVGNGDPTGIPVEPPDLNQNPDTEWTRNDNEPRRYLPTPEESNNATDPSTRTANTGGGPNIRDFGNNLSLGAFLNTPLEALRYGTDRYVDPGRIIVGGVEQSPGSGTTDVPQYGPEVTDRELADMDAARHRNMESNPDTRGNMLSNPGPIAGDTTPPAGMRIIGHDTQNGQPIYEDSRGNRFVNPGTGRTVDPTNGIVNNRQYDRATFGGVTPTVIRDPRGSAIGNLPENTRAANAMLMASQAFGGNPNLVQPDEVSRRLGQRGHLDEFGQYVQDGNIGGDYNPESFRAFVYGSQHRDAAPGRIQPRGATLAGRGGYPAFAGSGGRGG